MFIRKLREPRETSRNARKPLMRGPLVRADRPRRVRARARVTPDAEPQSSIGPLETRRNAGLPPALPRMPGCVPRRPRLPVVRLGRPRPGPRPRGSPTAGSSRSSPGRRGACRAPPTPVDPNSTQSRGNPHADPQNHQRWAHRLARARSPSHRRAARLEGYGRRPTVRPGRRQPWHARRRDPRGLVGRPLARRDRRDPRRPVRRRGRDPRGRRALPPPLLLH